MHHLDLIFGARMRAFFCSLSDQLKGQHIFRKGLCIFRKGQLQFQKLKRSPPTKSHQRLLDNAGDSTLDLAGPMKRGEKKEKLEREKEKREKKEGEKVRPVGHAKHLFMICVPFAFAVFACCFLLNAKHHLMFCAQNSI